MSSSDDADQARCEALIGIGEYLMSMGALLAVEHDCGDEVCMRRDQQAKALVWQRIKTMLKGALALADNDAAAAARVLILMAAEDGDYTGGIN